jgi:DNA-binding response OmpR family regulator
MKRILIVDDEELIRESVSDLLQLKGYEVLQAFDGFSGLLEAFKYNPDLILLEVMMPKIDGYTFLARLRANPAFHLTPVIMLSAKAKLEDQRHGLDLGSDDYLFKPFKSDELLQTIEVKLEKFEKSNKIFKFQVAYPCIMFI